MQENIINTSPAPQTPQERTSAESKFGNIIDVLSILARDRVYRPLDILSRSQDPDQILQAMYEALRYVFSGKTTPESLHVNANALQRELEDFVELARRGRMFEIRRVAILAYSKGVKGGTPGQQSAQQKQG